MEYEYSLPFPVELDFGDRFPIADDEGQIYEILSVYCQHGRGSNRLVALTLGGQGLDIDHPLNMGIPARWFVSEDCPVELRGTEPDHAILWVRTVSKPERAQAEDSGEAEAPAAQKAEAPEKPPVRRNTRRTAAAQEPPDDPSPDDPGDLDPEPPTA